MNFYSACMQYQKLPGKLQLEFSAPGVANQIFDFSMSLYISYFFAFIEKGSCCEHSAWPETMTLGHECTESALQFIGSARVGDSGSIFSVLLLYL